MMRHSKLALLFSVILLLSACAVTKKSPPHQDPGVRPDTTGPGLELAEAAVSVSRSLNEVAAMEKASKSIPRADMPDLVSVDWSGPVEPLLRQLAKISGYRLRVLGVNPAIPVLVTVNATELPLADVVRDVQLQSSKKATVLVYPKTRILELRYLRA